MKTDLKKRSKENSYKPHPAHLSSSCTHFSVINITTCLTDKMWWVFYKKIHYQFIINYFMLIRAIKLSLFKYYIILFSTNVDKSNKYLIAPLFHKRFHAKCCKRFLKDLIFINSSTLLNREFLIAYQRELNHKSREIYFFSSLQKCSFIIQWKLLLRI